MLSKQLIIVYCCCLSLSCHGAIWKTEEAYIIDDLPENDVDTGATEGSNSCTDSSGAQGQCVSAEECNGHYKFFMSQDTQTKLGILPGLRQYLNGTNLEPCSPVNQTASSSEVITSSYVCCTSLKYSSIRSTTLTEYNVLTANETGDVPVPELQPAIPESIDQNIVHGDKARPGEFPFAVAIIYRGQQVCGGSLIGSLWVLSAAHCFDRFNSQAVRSLVIKVGDHNIATTGDAQHQDVSVSKLLLHPGFFRDKGYFRDDIALIKLRTPVSPASNIRQVSLHTGTPSINKQSVEATVCGWGKTCGGSYCPQSIELRKTKLGLVSNSQCSQRYAGTAAPPITNKMICAGGNSGQDACNGDSGGPLVIYSGGQTYQIGIVSWGIGCGQYPGVYTRVSSFISWVHKHMQK